jgi:hypothetical protein
VDAFSEFEILIGLRRLLVARVSVTRGRKIAEASLGGQDLLDGVK